MKILAIEKDADGLIGDNFKPLVQNGLITFDLMSLNPCTGFARLFAK